MARKTYTTNDLNPGDVFYIKGVTNFSRISKQIDGEDLARSIERERQRGSKYPTTEPHTLMTIDNAKVWVKDPKNLSKVEVFARESCFEITNRETGAKTIRFTGRNKSPQLPKVLVVDPENRKVYNEVRLDKEPDNGLKVTLVMRVFKTNKGNNGVSLDAVMFDEPLRYWENGVLTKLNELGITVNSLPAEEAKLGDMAPAPEEDETTLPVGETDGDCFATGIETVMPNPYADPNEVNLDNSGLIGGLVLPD